MCIQPLVTVAVAYGVFRGRDIRLDGAKIHGVKINLNCNKRNRLNNMCDSRTTDSIRA